MEVQGGQADAVAKELAEILRNNFDFPGDVKVLSATELDMNMKETVRSSRL